MFAQLYRLGAPLGAEFVEKATGMSLDRILADKEATGDFPIAQSGGDQAEIKKFMTPAKAIEHQP